MAEPQKTQKAEQKVTVRALVVLRGSKGKKISIGETVEVDEAVSEILVANKQAELVKEK